MASISPVGARHNTSQKSQFTSKGVSVSSSRLPKDYSSESVHQGEANWDDRHHVLFSNRIQQNARSYFDRWRDFPDWRAPPEALSLWEQQRVARKKTGRSSPVLVAGKNKDGSPLPTWRSPTCASLCCRRPRIDKSNRLPVTWKLNIPALKAQETIDMVLTRSESEATTFQRENRRRRRPAWFSGHDHEF
mmetsp:Transcript_16938/g.30664  ORF Transcript_16938/g.30664 Transcript_16938/m.30664 type:complete len:190 (-) Transcript_16938:83-652(-)